MSNEAGKVGLLPPDDDGNARSFVRPARSEGWQIAQTFGPNAVENADRIALIGTAFDDMLTALDDAQACFARAALLGVITDLEREVWADVSAVISKARGGAGG